MEEVVYDEGAITIEEISNIKEPEYHGPEKSKENSYDNGRKNFRKPFTPNEPSVKTIFTDGGSKAYNLPEGKHWVGAWAFYDEDTKEIFGDAADNATNNQMELTAVLETLKYLDRLGIGKENWVTIKLDSDYVRFGILFWIKKWIKNGWKRINRDGSVEEVKNRDLWEQIYDLASSRKIFWVHVPGHSGVEGNEVVDSKCGQLIREFADNNGITSRVLGK